MTGLQANSLLPFVPSGKDYGASRQLFADLGFEEVWENGGYAGFKNAGAEFILQKYDNETFAQNFMVRLNVEDFEAWWNLVLAKRLPDKYPGVRLGTPCDEPWGKEVTLIDLAGVCWHVGERR